MAATSQAVSSAVIAKEEPIFNTKNLWLTLAAFMFF